MEKTEHVFLAGAGANQFALEMGVELADDAYFFTEHRYEQLLHARDAGVVELDHTASEPAAVTAGLTQESGNGRADRSIQPPATAGDSEKNSLGTVGAVACDLDGNVAAATSTGGMTNKKFGRLGDTPLIGAGTYADNGTCAVSCTGHGEYFMLQVTAYDVAARMKYKGMNLFEAAKQTIGDLTAIGGEGGLIAVDALGNVTLPFNSEGMYRAYITAGSGPVTCIYRES
jgi:beta-aspartyl-peptidase (threonine type)